ncbi:hypothetical protein [Curtobacterium sp. PhB130]|uniref:hypothetical protein n=1 Tax=Curtobacterium sp. PhB130 TaxID=2485178 RepID=UPI0011CD9D5B|nr:hypothetical protein [Curtobacterium sp. PhB130]
MQWTDDVERGAWLLDRVGRWATPGGVAGIGFAAYARILHPPTADREAATGVPAVDGRALRWADVAARTGRVVHPLVQWSRLVGREDELPRSFDDGWTIWPPPQGWCAPEQFAVLARHLAVATHTPSDLTAGVWTGWGDLNGSATAGVLWRGDQEPTPGEIAETQAEAVRAMHARVAEDLRRGVVAGPVLEWPGRDFALLRTSVAELGGPSWLDVGHTPQMLWPEGHEWVVASEIDWDSTIVAGPRGLVDAVLADGRLEVFEVDVDADLTQSGDEVDVRRR